MLTHNSPTAELTASLLIVPLMPFENNSYIARPKPVSLPDFDNNGVLALSLIVALHCFKLKNIIRN